MSSSTAALAAGLFATELDIVHTSILPVVKKLLNAIHDDLKLVQQELSLHEHIRIHISDGKVDGIEPLESGYIYAFSGSKTDADLIKYTAVPRVNEKDAFAYASFSGSNVALYCDVSQQKEGERFQYDITIYLHNNAHTIHYRHNTGILSPDVAQFGIYRDASVTHVVFGCHDDDIVGCINRI